MLNKENFDKVVTALISGEKYENFKDFNCDGFKLNPKEDHVKTIVEGLKVKSRYCPCKVIKDDINICPCVEFIELGKCCCKLWVKE